MLNNKKIKNSLIIIIFIILFLSINKTFADNLVYNMSQNISSNQFDNGGMINIFFGYYKWIILWMTILNVLGSLIIGLKLIGSYDKEDISRNKKALINLNLSYFVLIFLSAIIAFVMYAIEPKLKDKVFRGKDNTLLMGGGLYNDVSPFEEDVNKLNNSINNIKSNSAILSAYGEDLANINSENAQTVLDLQNAYNKVTNLISKTDTSTSDFLNKIGLKGNLISKAEAEQIAPTIKDKVKKLLDLGPENGGISQTEYDNFNKALNLVMNKLK